MILPLQYWAFVACCISYGYSDLSSPDNFVYRYEDVPIGTYLTTLTASGTNVEIIGLDESTRKLTNLSEPLIVGSDTIVNVTLAEILDMDFAPFERNLWFTANYSPPQSAIDLKVVLVILDVNEHPPSFQGRPYQANPYENASVGDIIFNSISTMDPDEQQTVTFSLESSPDYEGLFVLEQSSQSALIRLNGTFDYERRNIYILTITASDAEGLNSSEIVEISVVDLQDTPPFFLFNIYRAAVEENGILNASVIKLQAEDGDRSEHKNRIEYSIIEGQTDWFFIDSNTGEIFTKKVFDREDPLVIGINGVFELLVQATEVNTTLAQPSGDTAEVRVYITIEDSNDNQPTFNMSEVYTAFVRNDVPDDSFIYFEGDGYMQVYDKDQTGSSATFVLTIEQGGQLSTMFTPNPKEVFSEANVLIRVTDASALRALGESLINLEVIAREKNTHENFSSKARVVLYINDVDPTTTTPMPEEGFQLEAPDIVVFVVGFLVLLNIVTSVVICYMMRRRKDKRGLSRHGSKYYIKKRNTNEFTNHGLNNPSTSEMIEVDPEVAVCPRLGNGEYAE